jgi:hypothetical protein
MHRIWFSIIATVLAGTILLGCEECEKSTDCSSGQVCSNGSCSDQGGSGFGDGSCPFNHHLEGDECVCNPGLKKQNDICVGTDECEEPFAVLPALIDLEDISPTDDPSSSVLIYENVWPITAEVTSAEVTMEVDTCGSFSLSETLVPVGVVPDEKLEIGIDFVPDANSHSGCACRSIGFVDLEIKGPDSCAVESIPLIARGHCTDSLFCNLTNVEFTGAKIDSSYSREISCYNLNVSGVSVQDVSLTTNSSSAYEIELGDTSIPAQLQLADSISFSVSYDPMETGVDQGEVTITLENQASVTISLFGEADRERPLCSDGLPDPPEIILEMDNYEILLESPDISYYPGAVRSQTFYNDQPPLISDIVVTSGTFSDPSCEVWQEGHRYYWQDCNPEGGTINNVHAVPHSEQVDSWVRSLSIWDEITVVGYEVDRINYDDGSWWTDAGCNTMIVTWICDGEL